ncbi:MAG: hypothetical protein M3O23_04165 [Actinomycetota bacterium]|nr:hypothetical protein [Actinomycetota bacterium]
MSSQIFGIAGGRLRLRPPLSGLTSLEPRPGTEAVVLVALGSTTFDGVSRSEMWLELTSGLDRWPLAAVTMVGLLAVIGVVALAYYASMRTAARSSPDHDTGALATAFIHTLVPVVLAYHRLGAGRRHRRRAHRRGGAGHDRALVLFPSRVATRSQYPLLAAMVLFTVGALKLLISG